MVGQLRRTSEVFLVLQPVREVEVNGDTLPAKPWYALFPSQNSCQRAVFDMNTLYTDPIRRRITATLPSPPRTTSTIRGLLPRLPLRILGFNGHAVPRSWLLLRLPPPTVGDPARPTLIGCVASRATAIPSSFAPPRTPSPRRAAWASTLGLPSPRELLRPQPQLC